AFRFAYLSLGRTGSAGASCKPPTKRAPRDTTGWLCVGNKSRTVGEPRGDRPIHRMALECRGFRSALRFPSSLGPDPESPRLVGKCEVFPSGGDCTAGDRVLEGVGSELGSLRFSRDRRHSA